MAASKIKLNKMSLNELLDLKTRVEAQIQSVAANEVVSLEKKLAKLKTYAKANPAAAPAKPLRANADIAAEGRVVKRKTRKTRKTKGTKAPIKFKDPKSGKTWAGRGMTPLWLKEYEAKGEKREKFAV